MGRENSQDGPRDFEVPGALHFEFEAVRGRPFPVRYLHFRLPGFAATRGSERAQGGHEKRAARYSCTIEEGMINKQKDIESEDVVVRELPTYRPLFWFDLPEGPKREALRLEQEKPGYKYFNR